MQLERYFLIHNSYEYTVIAVIAALTAARVFYYLFFYARILPKPKNGISANMPISVIIAAHNEAENLRIFLPKVMTQTYPNFEVIVVNDRSEDDTNEVLVEIRAKYPNFYFTNIEENPRFPSGKKLALTVGIKAAKHEHLAFTDADCYPENEFWLQSVADSYISERTQVVLAYGGYAKTGSLLNTLIRFETLWIGLQYLTFARAGVPYMGVGRNLSYTKTIYDEQKGFSGHYHLHSGDDDLFVNKAANRKNTAATWHPNSRTRSVSETKFANYVLQKARHFTTWKHYRFLHKLLLGGELFSRVLFYAGLIFAFAFGISAGYPLSFLVFMLIIQYTVIGLAAKRLGEKGVAVFAPLFDILMPFVHLRISIAGMFIRKRKKKRWN